MKEIVYKCDECKASVSDGCIGVIGPGKLEVDLRAKVTDPYDTLFCNLQCFAKYYSKVRLEETERLYA